MKKEEKYFWRIGCPPPILQQHSAVKHRITESYVRDYILTLMSRATMPKLQLTLVDGFSGGGLYLDEDNVTLVDGSPLLMLRAAREARVHLNIGREKLRDVSVDYEFIDIDHDTIDYLSWLIKARREEGLIDPLDAQRIKVTRGDFRQQLPRLITSIKSRKMGEHAIFALDQYSYNDLPLGDMQNILRQLGGAEIILTFNVGSLTTYMADHAATRKPMENIGLDKYIPWEHIRQIKATEGQSWRRALQRYLAQGIREVCGAKYITLFFVRPFGQNTWDYWLIHLSNHFRAHDVMKQLHWAHATEFGHELEPGVFLMGYDANKDESYTGQPPFDFGENSREACVNGIREHLGQKLYEYKKPISLRDLIQSCASNSPGSTRHFLEAAKQLHHSNDVIVMGADGKKRRRSKRYNLSDIVEYSPQIKLL